jgi:hypothetical protein
MALSGEAFFCLDLFGSRMFELSSFFEERQESGRNILVEVIFMIYRQKGLFPTLQFFSKSEQYPGNWQEYPAFTSIDNKKLPNC